MINTQKIHSKINFALEKIFNKTLDNNSKSLLEDSIILNGVKLIESISKKENKRMFQYIYDNYHNAVFSFNFISLKRHNIDDNADIINLYLFHLNKILIEMNREDLIFNYKNDEYFNWVDIDDKDKKRNYNSIIISRKSSGNDYVYELAFAERGFKQKNLHIVYSNQFLSIGGNYIIDWDIRIMNLGDFQIKRKWIKKAVIQSLDLNYNLNELEKKYNQKILDLTFIDGNYWTDEISFSLKEYFKDLNPLDTWSDFLNRVFLLRTFDKNFINQNSKNLSPLYYEFWTKYPRVKNVFSYQDKLKIEILWKKFGSPEEEIWGLNNYLFSKFLARNKKYEYISNDLDVNEYFPKNNRFSLNEERFYNLKVNKIDSCVRNHNSISTMNAIDKILDNNKKYKFHENIDKNNNLDVDQYKALKNVLGNSKVVIIGQAGSGKSRLVSEINKYLEPKEKLIYIARTRKASRIPEENNCNIDSTTISDFILNNLKYSEYSTIIIDECSMIDDDDWKKIKDIISPKRVILIGDGKQIPPLFSVGAFDFYVNKKIKKIIYSKLFGNYRQMGKNKEYVEGIRKRKLYFKNDSNVILSFDSYESFLKILEKLNKKNYVFLSPIKHSLYGVNDISSILHSSSNNFKVGDRVIIKESLDKIKGLYQGKEMTIEKIENNRFYFLEKEKQIYLLSREISNWISIDGKWVYKEDPNEDYPFYHANIQTVHVSQGSTIENVCLIIPKNYRISWEILYTAISRSKKSFKIICYGGEIENSILNHEYNESFEEFIKRIKK